MSEGEFDNVVQLFRQQPGAIADGQSPGDPIQRFVILWQSMYLHRGQSLADPETADSLRVAIEVITLLVRGACATGSISETQRDHLLTHIQLGLTAADEFSPR